MLTITACSIIFTFVTRNSSSIQFSISASQQYVGPTILVLTWHDHS